MRRSLLAASALLGLATFPAGAQNRALGDRDFQMAETLLRLEAARLGNATVVQAARSDYIEDAAKTTQAVIDGKADALASAQRLRPEFLAPPGGRYDAACSRVASRAWYPWLAVAYTFGVAADEIGRSILAGDSTVLESVITRDLQPRPRSPEGQRVRALMERVFEFYESKGYQPHPQYPFIHRWGLGGEGGLVVMEPINPWYDAGCRHLGDGPTLVILPGSNASETLLVSETRVHDIADQWDAALGRFGLAQEQWYALRSDVMLAHDDAHATQAIEANIEKDLLPFLAESIALRKRNAAAYKRHAARLDPLVRATKVDMP